MSMARRGFLARIGAVLTGLFAAKVARASSGEPEPSQVPGEGSGAPYRLASPEPPGGVEGSFNHPIQAQSAEQRAPSVFTGMADPDDVQGREGDVYYQPWDRGGEYGCKLWVHTGVGWTRARVIPRL